jgi:hypothetical protein
VSQCWLGAISKPPCISEWPAWLVKAACFKEGDGWVVEMRDKDLEAMCLWIITVKAARLISGCNALGAVEDASARGHHHLWPRLHGDSGCNAIVCC